MPRRIVAVTPAKINLGLEILGRRADGYHDIVTIMQAVSLHDRLIWRESGKTFRYLSPISDEPEADLAARALAHGIERERWNGTLALEKSIPVAAGLGGGSSDAALALKVAIPGASSDRLQSMAAKLGSDVPFFLDGGTAIARGTGIHLTRLPTPSFWAVLVSPAVAIPSKTRTLYQLLRPGDFTDGSAVEDAARSLAETGNLALPLPNAFAGLLMEYVPIRAAAVALERAGAPWVSVSGAGPTLFTLVHTFAHARSITRRIPPRVGRIILARTIPGTGHHANAATLGQYLRSGDGLR